MPDPYIPQNRYIFGQIRADTETVAICPYVVVFGRMNMGIRSSKLCWQVALLPLAAVCVAGCVAPAHFGRTHVEGELEGRMGHGIGPEKLPCDIALPNLVHWGDGLTEEEAVAIGIWNNPSYQELLADLNITQADLIEASQIANPFVLTMFPIGAKQWELALMVPLDVLLLRPRRVAAAQLESKRVAERLVQDGLNVIRDVRIAYADVVQADQELKLAAEGQQLKAELARISEARLQAGALSELGISAMRLDAMSSEEQVVRSSRRLELATQKLRYQLGIQTPDISVSSQNLEDHVFIDLEIGHLTSDAVASRPDLRALAMAMAAAEERAGLARWDYFDVWGALPDLNSQGEKGFEAGPGMRFNLPIFNQNQGSIARARAQVERLQRRYAKQRELVILEVRRAYTELERARQSLAIWREKVVPEAEKAVEAARDALKEDGVSLPLVLETTRQLLEARRQELQASADVRRAFAELERSVGRRLLTRHAADDIEELVPPEPDPVPHDLPDGESGEVRVMP